MEEFRDNGYRPATCGAARPEAARSLAEAVGRGGPHELDAQRGLHVQQVIEAAEADLLGVETPSMVRHEAGLSSDLSGRIAADGPR
ncbi:MAG TPA: hypothetical protein VG253_04260 [Streptosporangiaceae bacterium]|nr:hypothetical protein [Streptosporangiaceae bacterium]